MTSYFVSLSYYRFSGRRLARTNGSGSVFARRPIFLSPTKQSRFMHFARGSIEIYFKIKEKR
jgi:hypothetical protein